VEITQVEGISPAELWKMAGKWDVLVNDNKFKMEISDQGRITIISGAPGRSSDIIPSDNQNQFPSADGWYKVNDLVYDKSWDYIRNKKDGTFDIAHFCNPDPASDWAPCRSSYKGLENYCCSG
jgi:hypothetical protein